MEPYSPRPGLLENAEIRRRQRGRNLAMLWALLGLAALFFAITLVKLSQG